MMHDERFIQGNTIATFPSPIDTFQQKYKFIAVKRIMSIILAHPMSESTASPVLNTIVDITMATRKFWPHAISPSSHRHDK